MLRSIPARTCDAWARDAGAFDSAPERLRRGFRAWLRERDGADGEPLFVCDRGDRLSRDAVELIVRKHVDLAARTCPTLKGKRVAPHVLRHSAAMQLLQNGVDRTVIALWLEHESVESTQMYVHANIQIKEQALARPNRWRSHPVAIGQTTNCSPSSKALIMPTSLARAP